MATVVISLGGVDVTDRVLFASATFTQRVNGKPGSAYMRLRDNAETLSVATGVDWLVTVDGDAAWRGFATQVSRVYAFDAEDVSERMGRFIDVRGADLNLLLAKRRVFNQADPTIGGKQFAAGASDTTALTELFTNWLDLSSDSLDTDFTHVGDLDPDEKAWIGWAGWTLADAMANIAMLPGAIFYVRPNAGTPRGTVVYCDADSATAPFGLSDVPDGTTTKGYREMEILEDGTSLANDVMGWGMGYGSQTPVFQRMQDATSIATHGRWQTSQVTVGVYKQATINRIVDSIINGSPENLRGAKDDMPSVRLVTWEPGLVAGDVVDFESQVWGWSDNIPVREMTITFPSPTDPRYEILLSHEVDAPWSSLDLWWPKIPPPNPVWPPPPDIEEECPPDGLEDDFDRILSGEWGTSTPGGHQWHVGGEFWAAWVDSGNGWLGGTTLDQTVISYAWLDFTLNAGYVVEFRWYTDALLTPITTCFDVIPLSGTNAWWRTQVLVGASEFEWKTWLDGDPEPPSYTDSVPASPGVVFSVRFVNDTGQDATFRVDDVSIWGDCVPVGLPYGVNGYGCVRATRISSANFGVPSPFAAGSTLVWRSGLLQLRGTDYTENSDHMGIAFSDPVELSETVRICYFGEVVTP